MGRVKGKVAIVTGGARGMGASHCRQLLAEGAKVVITDILTEEGQALATSLGNNALFIQHDVTQEAQWLEVIKTTEAHFGPVSVLVNNAGISAITPIDTTSIEEYRRVIDINQTSVFLGMKHILPSMKKAGGGSIINISSIAGMIASPSSLAYCASKFAVRGMTKVAAVDYAKFNIRVNSIHPGIIKTSMTDMDGENAEIIKPFIQASPAKRVGDPEEVSAIVIMLASDECQFVTGSEFVVDGGVTSL